ncbi:MAG: hypothetical protein JWN01_802 [Patescibacteria group bacterium]|nr:hypothetical protein [Patescibacteria group bacterium]
MNDPDSVRRRTRAREDSETFRETLAAPIPNQTYRSQVDLIDTRPSAIEQAVRLIATLLSLLLVGRLIAGLFTTSPTNGYLSFFYAATNWMVWPFQAIFGQPPINTTGGFFDWPAVAALVAVSLIAGLLIRAIRPPSI